MFRLAISFCEFPEEIEESILSGALSRASEGEFNIGGTLQD